MEDLASVNGYRPADAYNILRGLLRRNEEKSQRGEGALSGSEIAVIGGCMTILRHRDRSLQEQEHKATVLP